MSSKYTSAGLFSVNVQISPSINGATPLMLHKDYNVQSKITHDITFFQLKMGILFIRFVFSTVPPAKTQGPNRSLHQEGCLCPRGSSQSCCCPTVRPPDRTEGVNGWTRADRRTLRNTHGRCVRGVDAPLTEAFPVEALEPPEGQKAGCHGYRLRSENECDASFLLVFLNILHSVFLISQPL